MLDCSAFVTLLKAHTVFRTQLPYSTKHWREKILVDLAVDSQSAKVLSINFFFHHDFVQAVAIANKVGINKSASCVVPHYTAKTLL